MTIFLVALNLKYSGTLTRDEIWKNKLRKILWVTIYWTIARFANGVINIIAAFSKSGFSKSFH